MGADPNHSLYWSNEWWRGPPLHLACKSGKLQIARILVERSGANINRGDGSWDRSPLHWACEGGYDDLVKYLIEEAKCNVGEYQYFISNNVVLCSKGYIYSLYTVLRVQ